MQKWVLYALSWKQRKATEHVSQYKFPAMIQHGYSIYFYVLLTMHLNIILVTDQLNTQIPVS